MKTLNPVSPPQLTRPLLRPCPTCYMKCFLKYRVYNYNYKYNNDNYLNVVSSSYSSSSKTSASTLTSTPSSSSSSSSSSSVLVSAVETFRFKTPWKYNPDLLEEALEKVIYRFRFVTFLGVFGSLFGSLLCFIKGCSIVVASFFEHFAKSGKAISLMIEAIDIYLLGTVMLVFGMGLYELFVSNLDIAKSLPDAKHLNRSNLFGLFTLMERPKWLEIKSVNELKTKVGHVIVMLLLIGLFDNCKKAAINTSTDLLCFSASVLLCSGCLYLLSKLNGSS